MDLCHSMLTPLLNQKKTEKIWRMWISTLMIVSCLLICANQIRNPRFIRKPGAGGMIIWWCWLGWIDTGTATENAEEPAGEIIQTSITTLANNVTWTIVPIVSIALRKQSWSRKLKLKKTQMNLEFRKLFIVHLRTLTSKFHQSSQIKIFTIVLTRN